MVSGVSKDFIFILKVPAFPSDYQLKDGDSFKVIDVSYRAKGINGESLHGEAQLHLSLVSEDFAIDENLDDADVIENNLRLEATEAMQKSIEFAEEDDFIQAK